MGGVVAGRGGVEGVRVGVGEQLDLEGLELKELELVDLELEKLDLEDLELEFGLRVGERGVGGVGGCSWSWSWSWSWRSC